MRWLVGHPGPSFSVADVHDGWVEALRGLGEEVYTFNLDDRLMFYDSAMIEVAGGDTQDGKGVFRKAISREQAIGLAANGILSAAYQCWPHVILLVSAFFTPPALLDMMRGRGHKIVLLHTESPYQDDEQLVRAAHADVNLVNDPVNLGAYAELGPAAYMPHAYRESVHYPDPGAVKLWDFSFIGTGFPSRVKFFEAMNLDGLDVRLAGPWIDLPEESPLRQYADPNPEGCVDNEQTADIYRQSLTGLNLYRRESEASHEGEGWAISPREVEMCATELFFLRDPRGEGDEVLPMLPTFDGPQDASEKLHWWLAHDLQREAAARKAHETIAGRTFTNNAKGLLRLLDQLK